MITHVTFNYAVHKYRYDDLHFITYIHYYFYYWRTNYSQQYVETGWHVYLINMSYVCVFVNLCIIMYLYD